MTTIHAFSDDALGNHDAVALAQMVRGRQVSPEELAAAAAARAQLVDPELHAVACQLPPRHGTNPNAELFGVPTFIKDNTDVAGLPTTHGSEAFTARPAKKDGAYTTQFLSTGMTLLGKTRMPEFGFNASTEYMTEEPVRNPWHPEYSVGASSGGSAALVAAGVVPIAHANDGGGSIRIPAACAGLVGLKPSRGRHRDGEQVSHLPIHMISEGVLTRSVRDTAAFVAACENHWRNPKLAPIGRVCGPAQRKLRVGMLMDSVTGESVDGPTREAVEQTAALLETAGHVVEPITLPVTSQFADDFVQYWALLADLAVGTGRLILDRSFDAAKADGLSLGLRAQHRRTLHRTPGALLRLRRVADQYARMFARHEVVLSPVLSHTTPRIGYISPTVDFPDLIDRLRRYVAYTPLNNIAGTPAISLPAGLSPDGLPIGIQLSAAYGDERTLLEMAFLLEAERPFTLPSSSETSSRAT
ncbi:amidase [Mycobacterium sp. CBMA293]|uniref:amidase n=2 Tax=Mycolicibacterium TaxID=1866885 RepID=UPI0012DCD1AF|nr:MULTISPECIES: amidase [unclassified Mycolicibacterium]MUL48032.1 amidase [Mycolicibacterium sp. CBMA 360]MUL58210.1 amidase [Mycolicibacterium sp. CBMA 335]MUL73668.1 amidase [Mycolicibacterium sp. CBMA 311]MUL93093.1 amidase [Mycolicibacterium sp. CBMA 230]MUM07642.1 amidase [Mycolicibacterium sp. CBMA 213]